MSPYETLKLPHQNGTAIELRPMSSEDARTLRMLLSHPQVKPHIVMRPGGSQPAFMDKLINRMLYAIDPSALHTGIYRRGQQELVGTVSLQNWNRQEGRAILGYMVDPKWWGHGYATEAVGLLLNYGFQELGLKVVEGRCRGDNTGSERVMLKNGLQLERTVPIVASGGDVMKVFRLCYTNEIMPL
ncbi:GNAT family N-acetyltransferase [Paenibacillus sp. NPDC057934]|uniref:GNAT family N-acetyltransferase n=1 Tax=Paenibacillus sp. NPDC057934 TaxID=3346282 RepID=UPI0036DEFE51